MILAKGGARRDVCAGQKTGAEQEFLNHQGSGELEGFAEEFGPIVLGARIMGHQPIRKAAMAGSQLDDLLGIVNGGVHLQTVADDTSIGQQPVPIGLVKRRHFIDIEPIPKLIEKHWRKKIFGPNVSDPIAVV